MFERKAGALAGLAAPTYTPNQRCLLKPWLDDASPLADAIRRGEIRSAEAVEASLEAIANSKLNALTFLDAEGARRQAEQIDARIARGEDAGLLSGVPILVKDVEDAAGWPAQAGWMPSAIPGPRIRARPALPGCSRRPGMPGGR